MRYMLTAMGLLALLTHVRADEFHLTDATGKKHGPFEFRQGARITVAGQEFTISKVITKAEKITEKMKVTVIPELDFRQAHIRDVIAFLQQASVDFAPKGTARPGVSCVLNLPRPKAQPLGRDLDPFAEVPQSVVKPVVPFVTFRARHISLYEVMNIICKICDLKWSVQDSVVMIEPGKKETGR